ncbi:MAG: peptide-methionine (S)-S-oxide reductase MsrA [Candidatus Methylomirabilis sp.]|nr:peptide-methionine (S)-S-oxide reductase MsrA [Deltaproteobacteria bacterium]
MNGRTAAGALLALLAAVAAGVAMAETSAQTETAVFAGGCFWCMEAEFAAVPGVRKVVSGYTGGTVRNPTYEQVCTGRTGHFEAIEVTFDPAQVGYAKLLEIFWTNVDPLDPHGQFCDKGSQYRAGVFHRGEAQRRLAEASKAKVREMFGREIATVVAPASEFFPAEDYHQEYYIKSKLRYKLYRAGCGRDERLEELWKDKPAPEVSK